MNPLLKTRSDYRHLKMVDRSRPYIPISWTLPIICLAMGFVLGIFFDKKMGTFKGEMIAMTKVDKAVTPV